MAILVKNAVLATRFSDDTMDVLETEDAEATNKSDEPKPFTDKDSLEDLLALTVVELKGRLREAGLTMSGKKTLLID